LKLSINIFVKVEESF